MIHSIQDTIAAIATPPGKGAIAVLRLSGHRSFEIAQSVVKSNVHFNSVKPASVVYGQILSTESAEPIDTVLVTKFKAPHSYTGEDVIEISCHGSPFITHEILNLLLQRGARLAEPGEFTKRAFIHGKLDLLQAESVADIIDAQTRQSRKQSQAQLSGVLSETILSLKERLKQQAALLEVELDFADEDVEFADRQDILKNIDELSEQIEVIISTFEYGKILREGAHLVIAGKPNVGKSSVLNRLLQEDRAIVSDTPGTTRDIIEESLDIQGMLFKISDTAGLRLSKDAIESEGVNRTKRILANADIILFIVDPSINEEAQDREAFEMIRSLVEGRFVLVKNKIDLGVYSVDSNFTNHFDTVCNLSAKTGEGFAQLENTLKHVIHHQHDVESNAVINKVRHKDALMRTRDHLMHARASLQQNLSPEFVALDLRSALNALGELAGEVTTEDILNDIFSQFCIGK